MLATTHLNDFNVPKNGLIICGNFFGKSFKEGLNNIHKLNPKTVIVLNAFELEIKNVIEHLMIHDFEDEYFNGLSIITEMASLNEFIRLSNSNYSKEYKRNALLDSKLMKFINEENYERLLNSKYSEYYVFAAHEIKKILKHKIKKLSTLLDSFCDTLELENNIEIENMDKITPCLEIFSLGNKSLNRYFFKDIINRYNIRDINKLCYKFKDEIINNIKIFDDIFKITHTKYILNRTLYIGDCIDVIDDQEIVLTFNTKENRESFSILPPFVEDVDRVVIGSKLKSDIAFLEDNNIKVCYIGTRTTSCYDCLKNKILGIDDNESYYEIENC